MKPIYADSVFFLNLATDYLLCLASARVCGLCLKRLRYLAAALLGAAYSVIILLPGMAFLASPAAKLTAGSIMALTAFWGERRPLRCCLVFFAVSALFGGALGLLSPGDGSHLPLPFSLAGFLLCFALCYIGLSLFFSGKGKLPLKPRVRVRLALGERESEFMALLDSGNSLSDPISGSKVMVLSPHVLKALISSGSELLEEKDPVELLRQSWRIPELAGKLRLVPYSAVGGSGMLAVFRPDRVFIDGRPQKEMLAAISPDLGGDGFDAII